MRAANITAGIAIIIWALLAISGRAGLKGIVAQHVPGYPNMGQVDLYIVWPMLVIVAVLACVAVCNALLRWSRLLGLFSGLSLIGALPYVIISRGGV